MQEDIDKAVSLYEEAALQGHTGAQCSIGRLLLIGDGVPQDFAFAAAWFRCVHRVLKI